MHTPAAVATQAITAWAGIAPTPTVERIPGQGAVFSTEYPELFLGALQNYAYPAALEGLPVQLSHGDLNPGNLMVAPDTLALTGILDVDHSDLPTFMGACVPPSLHPLTA